MAKELEMLREYKVFDIVLRPKGKNIVGSKWVYAIKWKENSSLERQKA